MKNLEDLRTLKTVKELLDYALDPELSLAEISFVCGVIAASGVGTREMINEIADLHYTERGFRREELVAVLKRWREKEL